MRHQAVRLWLWNSDPGGLSIHEESLAKKARHPQAKGLREAPKDIREKAEISLDFRNLSTRP